MNLTLVISNPAQLLHGCQPTRRFDAHGGSIGSVACDWLLRDRRQRVYPQHCRIHWRGTRACVTDQCGHTYANGHALPLGRDTTIHLNEGDFLDIGEYRIAVHLHAPALDDGDGRHLSQRSLNELLTGRRDELEDWNQQARPFSPPAAPAPMICPEFERLSRPFDVAQEQDPLRALQAIAPSSLLELACRVQASTRSHNSRVAGHFRFALLLLGCLTLGGCTLLGKLGQVIWNPSIPVGGPDDQPSQYSLSLYASPDVNPRMTLAGADPADPPIIREPYSVNVQAESAQALTEKLQSVLDHLYPTVAAQSPVTVEPEPSLPVSPVEFSPFAHYQVAGVSVSALENTPAPRAVASPIAFTVLQLSDDGLLQNATLSALLDDLKKTLGSTFIGADDYLLQPGQFKFIDLKALDPDTRFIAVIANYYDADNAQWKQTLRVQPTGRHYALLMHLDSAQIELKGETR